jgi:hypothetical protein
MPSNPQTVRVSQASWFYSLWPMQDLHKEYKFKVEESVSFEKDHVCPPWPPYPQNAAK